MRTDRRQNPRLIRNVPIKVRLPGQDVAIESMDISCNGICCRVNNCIPEMTRLEIIMILPPAGDSEDEIESSSHQVKCEGVVVRVEDELSESNTKTYNTAIYFDKIEEEEKQKLLSFVLNEIERGHKLNEDE
ncbi:MAG: PilZ domain-containing protein [Spirochaetes bacterium]|nr:PilZ domain-containing protein [Spirochaetota bacterium]